VNLRYFGVVMQRDFSPSMREFEPVIVASFNHGFVTD
jgi:hypothetical protein